MFVCSSVAQERIMQRRVILPFSLLILAWYPFVRPVRADDKPPAEKPFGLSKRIPWTTSRVVGSPEPPRPYHLDRVFPKLKFKGPVCIAQEPDTNRLMVAENDGKIFSFPIDDPNTDRSELFLDMKRSVYAFSFHPKYKENGYVFVFSPTPPGGTPGAQLSRVSRFQTGLEYPRVIKPESETVIIEWPSGGHNGGEAIVGPDGYLYICTGDGTSGSDVNNSGQGVDDLLSVMIRIDVDHPEPGRNYSIPKDNPFIHYPGARPEVWAHGFRNPWRMSFDSETGRLWVGDVGQDIWEMIRVVKKGGNYGWSVQEGSHPFHPHKKTGPGPIEPPVVEHHHTECRSITGGYVYHGSKFPELRGAYVYGDYQYGKIWGLRYDGQKVTWQSELADTAVFIASFGVTRDGDILAVDNSTGFIHALARTPPGAATSAFPRTLSETGLFASVKERKPAPGVIPYSVNAPYWSDGAHKERFLALPGETQFVDANGWAFPDGAVTVQTVSLDLEEGSPRSRTPIETRILVKQDDHWMGYTYLWNDTLTDATLVEPNGIDRVLTIKDPAAPGGVRQQTWHVPGRNECMFCHSRAAGFALGLNNSQMNRDQDYGGVVDNQIRTFGHIGLFKSTPTSAPASLPKFVDPYDTKADLNERARTYLHVNCSICHVSDGGGNSMIELAYGMSLADTKAVGGRPVQGTFGIADAMVIAPGEPERSVLYFRVSSLGGARMPRVGSRVVDEQALEMLYEWIVRMPNPNPADAAKANVQRVATDTFLKSLRDSASSNREARAEAIRELTATTSRALGLARVVAHESLPTPIRAEILAATKEHPNTEVRDVFERFLPESERIRRLGESINPREILDLTGISARGRAIFTAESVVNCKSCHLLDGVGVPIGPDLSKIGAKYPRAELLQHILEPSRFIDPKYTLYHIDTKDGLVHTGLLVERTEKFIVLRDAENHNLSISISEVETLSPQKQSLMPERLLQSLTAQHAADLLEYLTSLK
jgi:uncharacterized repeat protein (TIGR03806 family)